MADTPLTVYTLGAGGVDVDTDPILTADNTTHQSQNATFDPTNQRAGALVKRAGLDRFNTVAMSGAVLGGIEAPFAGTAGAPLSGGGGGGAAGDAGGTSAGQPPAGVSGGYGGGPGSTLITGSTGSSSGPGASLFNSGVIKFGGKKLIVIGRADNGVSGASGVGWFVTSKGFNDVALTLSGASGATGLGIPMNGPSLARLVGGVQAATVGQTANHDAVVGFPQSVTEGLFARPNGVLFYPQRMNPSQTTGPLVALNYPTIRRNDGSTDVVVATIPANPNWGIAPYATGRGMAIVGMGTRYGDGGHIYIAVHDRFGVGGVTIASDGGRVLRMDTASYALTEIFNTNPASGANYNASAGTLSPLLSGGGVEAWFGSVLEATGSVGKVNALVSAPAYSDAYANWIGYEGVFADKGDVTCMAIYKGALYVGHSNTAAVSAFAVINGNPLNSGLTLPGNPQLTASGGSAAATNHFVSMAIFQGKLYVSYWNKTQTAKIYSFDGTTWTAVFTSSATADQVPLNLQVDSDGDVLYAFGCIDGTPPAWFMTSLNGTTWVDKSANFPGGQNFPMNIFADFTQ